MGQVLERRKLSVGHFTGHLFGFEDIDICWEFDIRDSVLGSGTYAIRLP